MKKLIFVLLITNCSLQIINAQSLFQRTIGGTNHDYANCIIQTSDGGYAIAGYTFSFSYGYEDMYLVKLNSSGTIQWTKTIGGTGNDMAYSVIQISDGGYALGGYTRAFGADYFDYCIVKLDTGGSLQWSRTINRANNDYATAIVQTTDGGFVLTGLSATGGVFTTDMYIVKLNAVGTYQWSKTYGGGSGDDIGYSIIRTADGGFIAAGYSNSFGGGGNDFFIVKIDSIGTLQWCRTLWGTNYGSDVIYSIIQTLDGGFVFAGETQSSGAGNYDMYIIKLTGSGTLQWARTVGGTSEDRGYSIIQTIDSGYVVAGMTTSFGVSDFYTVKLNSGGTLQWSKTYGGSGIESANSIIKTTNGGFVIAGQTNSFGAGANDMYIVKIDASGNTCGSSFTPASISGSGGTLGSPTPSVITQNPTVTTPTFTTNTGGTLTTICFVGTQPISNEVPQSFSLSQNYPNPFNPSTKIQFALPKSSFAKIVVYDMLGREMETIVNEQLNAGTYEVDWSAEGGADKFASGVYYYVLKTENFIETKKMVLIK